MKAAKDFAAMILADMAGSSVPSENFSVSLAPGDHDTDDSSEEKSAPAYSIEDFIRECLCDGAYEILDIFRTDNPDLVFHNQKVVKASVAGINDYVSIRDYQAGRYSGVIDSRYKTMALYTAPVFGMSWSRWSTEKEISAIHVWRKERSFLQPDAMPLFEYYAGLIVTGPRQFYNLYHDIDHVRRNKTEVFGGPFDHLYIFPFTKDGANQLNLIMGNLDKDLYQEATQWLLDNGDYHRNHDGNSRVFPLRDSDGHATALCFLLDAKHLMLIEEIANQFPQDTFTALCSSWQEPYCRAALPDNVQIISISG